MPDRLEPNQSLYFEELRTCVPQTLPVESALLPPLCSHPWRCHCDRIGCLSSRHHSAQRSGRPGLGGRPRSLDHPRSDHRPRAGAPPCERPMQPDQRPPGPGALWALGAVCCGRDGPSHGADPRFQPRSGIKGTASPCCYRQSLKVMPIQRARLAFAHRSRPLDSRGGRLHTSAHEVARRLRTQVADER